MADCLSVWAQSNNKFQVVEPGYFSRGGALLKPSIEYLNKFLKNDCHTSEGRLGIFFQFLDHSPGYPVEVQDYPYKSL